MLLLAIWIIAEWYLTANQTYPEDWAYTTNLVILSLFIFETVLLTCLVRDKKRYLRTNWMNLLIIIAGIPLFWHDQPYAGALRTLRLLLVVGIFLEMSSTIRGMLRRNHVGITLFVAAIIVVMAGTTIAIIDPAIDTPWDGIWWAWVTVTTVGYGDIVPESPYGKIFGGFLMILGLGLFSLLTANFSAFLIVQEEEEFIDRERELASEERETAAKLERIESRLENLEKGLERLIDRMPRADAPNTESDSSSETSSKE